MHVSGLWIYPVKGAAAVAVSRWPVDDLGLRHDRRWMVVDAEGRFVSQRDAPALGSVLPSLEGDALVLRSRRAGEVRVPVGVDDGERVPSTVWGDTVTAIDAGGAAASFFSAHLERAVRLVWMPDDEVRAADPAYALPGDRVSFADGFPLLLITQASLDELNTRLPAPVPMLRFRPNVVVAGAAAHEEDGWRSIRAGSLPCDVVKPCARCVVTTIDAATGVPGREPLRTLATYRSWERKVWFGQNVIPRGTGVLALGDDVAVTSAAERRPPLPATPRASHTPAVPS